MRLCQHLFYTFFVIIFLIRVYGIGTEKIHNSAGRTKRNPLSPKQATWCYRKGGSVDLQNPEQHSGGVVSAEGSNWGQHRQGTLKITKNRDIKSEVSYANKKTNEMRRRNFCTKLILYLVIILLFAVNIGLIIWKASAHWSICFYFGRISSIICME